MADGRNNEADDVFHDENREFYEFVWGFLIAFGDVPNESLERVLLQASEIYWAKHPPKQISSRTGEYLEPLQLTGDPMDDEYFTAQISNEARSYTGDCSEHSQDDPTEIDTQDDTRQCGLAMFLHETFIAHREPLTQLLEADLLQALERYWAAHPPTQISSGTEGLPDDPVDEEHFTVHMSNETSTGDHPEHSQDDPMEIGVSNDTRQCGWMDETTNRRCPQFVPAGLRPLQPMLSHLNTVHNVRGSEKDPIECKWVVHRSGCEYACGKVSQRRNIPRHIAKHMGLRWMCQLCYKHFARSDLLRCHEHDDH